jgi:hypothetical protein
MALLKNMTPEEVGALRAAEREIDSAYADNPLLRESLGTAVWQVLSFVEDLQLLSIVQGRTELSHRWAASVDEILNALKFPMAWLHSGCSRAGEFRRCYEPTCYQGAWDILQLASRYYGFSGPFQYWDKGELGLRLQGTRIIAELDFGDTTEYEAYNRLIDYGEDQQPPPETESLAGDIDSLVRVKGTRFTIKVNPRLVERVMASVEPVFRERFTLPEFWRFSRYSLREFRLVYLAMFVLTAIQHRARLAAADRGCVGLGLDDAVIVTPRDDLISRVTRYTGLSAQPVLAVLDDLTYGNRQQQNPDPALQPLIQLSKSDYAVSPFLFLHSSPERNLCALLNRIPEERAIYSRLKDEKEGLMQCLIKAAAEEKGFRTVKGNIPGREDLGDIDLAIISDTEQACLLLELKWFIAPAEVREIIDRRKELQKGIAQVQARVTAIREGCPACRSLLEGAPSTILGVVVSKNWIGDSSIQKQSCPVISERHFLAKLNCIERLACIMDWLAGRRYLPVLGRHFSVETAEAGIGKWTTKWYAINSLMHEPFLPL